MTNEALGYAVEDVVYLKHGHTSLLARIYKPDGYGPFPAVVEIHGGAWSQFDRTRGKALHEALAISGIVVVALDFRQGAEGPYPQSSQDINYAIRWLKHNAERFGIDPQRVGICGNSSGGHLAMLAAMQPFDERYASIPLSGNTARVDATVKCAILLWPVINPIGRYHHAKRSLQLENLPNWNPARIITFQDAYWKNETNMAEASPVLMRERGERVQLPPTLIVSAPDDPVHKCRQR